MRSKKMFLVSAEKGETYLRRLGYSPTKYLKNQRILFTTSYAIAILNLNINTITLATR